jgi:hypothetical protein
LHLAIDMIHHLVLCAQDGDEWLNIDEAVAYMRSKGVKITRGTLYTRVSRLKKPKSYRIGRALRFKKSDLDAYVASITKER